jgi:hypothetical protein
MDEIPSNRWIELGIAVGRFRVKVKSQWAVILGDD